nr:MAG TPA: hypothetical protein [Inoviridae sp.]
MIFKRGDSFLKAESSGICRISNLLTKGKKLC